MTDNYNESFSKISEEVLEQCKLSFQQFGIQGCEDFLCRKAEEWKTIPLNIGIIGNSGTGKSSFINTIRGLAGDDDGAAAVGVTQTTLDPTSYAHHNNELLKFWDLPGVGTREFAQHGYLEKIGFEKYDFFLIISSDRFTENDQIIAVAIATKKKQFFFVRTKIHNSIENDKHDRSKAWREAGNNKEAIRKLQEEIMAKIRNNIRDNLEDLYKENKVFLVDNHHRNLYDFQYLEQRIIEEFPALKREAYILSVSMLSEDMVKQKVQVLRGQIWIHCLLSGAVAIIPLPGLSFAADLAIIVHRSLFFFRQLGLDDRSLSQTAKIMSRDVAELSNIVTLYKTEFPIMNLISYIEKEVSSAANISVVREVLNKFMSDEFMRAQVVKAITQYISLSAITEEVARFIPFVGALIAAPISAGTTYAILNDILTKMEEVALCVLNTAVENTFTSSVDSRLASETDNDQDE